MDNRNYLARDKEKNTPHNTCYANIKDKENYG